MQGSFANLAMQNIDSTALPTGCFTSIQQGVGGYGTAFTSAPFDGYALDLSLSNSIYGSATKVQPKAYTCLMIIKN